MPRHRTITNMLQIFLRQAEKESEGGAEGAEDAEAVPMGDRILQLWKFPLLLQQLADTEVMTQAAAIYLFHGSNQAEEMQAEADAKRSKQARKKQQKRRKKVDRKNMYLLDADPSNIKMLWLIHALFPDALVLHTQRNLMDAALSIYKWHPLAGASSDYARSVDSIGAVLREGQKLVEHWRSELPDMQLLDVSFEHLASTNATAREAELGRVLSFLGLEAKSKACYTASRRCSAMRGSGHDSLGPMWARVWQGQAETQRGRYEGDPVSAQENQVLELLQELDGASLVDEATFAQAEQVFASVAGLKPRRKRWSAPDLPGWKYRKLQTIPDARWAPNKVEQAKVIMDETKRLEELGPDEIERMNRASYISPRERTEMRRTGKIPSVGAGKGPQIKIKPGKKKGKKKGNKKGKKKGKKKGGK